MVLGKGRCIVELEGMLRTALVAVHVLILYAVDEIRPRLSSIHVEIPYALFVGLRV